MAQEHIIVRMLGGFSIEQNGQKIDDHSNRMRKVWLLLAYLIYHRNDHITQEHYIHLLRSKNDEFADPAGNLKVLFYRARALLNQLNETAGHDLILRKDGSYIWNPDFPLELDVETFERLCRDGTAAEEDDRRLALYLQALNLYTGDFLPKLAAEAWVMPISAYYHRIYMETVEKALELLMKQDRWDDIAQLCQAALKVEPYSETLYQYFMRCKLNSGDRKAAQAIYDEMSDLLFSTFGIMPSDESRALYREASRVAEGTFVPAGTIREQLRETAGVKGAMFCEYDFFKLLYQVQARTLIRSGDVIHIALFSVQGQDRKEISRRSLDRAMENLKELVIGNLRQGDVVTQCSMSQLITMMPQANYETSCAVCQRLIKAFYRQYPHSPVDIAFSVQPLEPMTPSALRA